MIFFLLNFSVEENWWEKLLEPCPEDKQCRIRNCNLAPIGHPTHPILP